MEKFSLRPLLDVLLSPSGQECAEALNEDNYGITSNLDETELYGEGEVKDPLLSSSRIRIGKK